MRWAEGGLSHCCQTHDKASHGRELLQGGKAVPAIIVVDYPEA